MERETEKNHPTLRDDLIRILEDGYPIKDNILGITMDIEGLGITIKHTKLKYILSKTQDPKEIADYLLATHRKEERTRIGALLKKNPSGRPRSGEYDLFRQAKSIVAGENLPAWKREFEIDRDAYELQRYQILKGLYGNQGKANLAVLNRMMEELNTLWGVMVVFQKLARDAQQKKDTLILNTIRMVFGDDANDYITDNKKQGNTIKWVSIRKRESVFWKYAESGCTTKIQSTFYDRDKPTGICTLAKKIHDILYQPHRMIIISTNRLRAMLKVSLLMEKYDIGLDDLKLNFSHLDAQKLKSIAAKPIIKRQNIRVDSKGTGRKQNQISDKAEEVQRTDIEKSIDTMRARFMLREELLEQLQDI